MSKLKQDEISLLITAETKEAQQKVAALEKKNRSLRTSVKDTRNRMLDLTAAGKKNSQEYQNLAAEYKKTNAQIKKNNTEIQTLTSKMDVNSMSMKQLKRRAKELRSQLDSMVQSADPKAYAALEQRLQKVGGRMNELRNNAKSLKDTMTGDTAMGFLGANLMMKAVEFAAQALDNMRELVDESVELARQAEGIEHAFDQLDNPDILNDLRAATHGTVDDVKLMQSAVKARDFQIPLKDLGKYLEFAQLKAQQTGQSVDYMTDSIVTGLGRKSALILDNLGLSAAQINEETKKTGDFMKAVATIVDQSLASAGEHYETSAERILQKQTEVKNAQLELGDAMLDFSESSKSAALSAEKGFLNTINWIIKYRKQIAVLIAAIVSYQVAVSAAAIKTALLTAAENVAAAAQWAWNAAIAANPIGLLVAGVVAAVGAIALMVGRTKEMSKAQKTLNDVNKTAADSIAQERSKIDEWNDTMHDANATLDERRAALAKLMAKIPGYHASITNEGKIIGETTDKIHEYITALEKKAKATAAEQKMEELYQDRLEELDKAQKHIDEQKDAPTYMGSTSWGGSYTLTQKVDFTEEEQGNIRDRATKETDEAIQRLKKYIRENNIGTDTTENQEVKDLIATKEEELKQAKSMKATTEAETAARNKKVQTIQKEIDRLKNLGVASTSTAKTTTASAKTTADAEKDMYKAMNDLRNEDLLKQEERNLDSQNKLAESLASKKITQEQYDMMMKQLATTNAEAILQIERGYYSDSQSLVVEDGEAKAEAVRSANARVLKARKAAGQAQVAEQQQMDALMSQLPQGTTQIANEDELNMQLGVLEAAYQSRRELAAGNDEELLQLDTAYQQAKAQLEQSFEDKKKQARQEYGLVDESEQKQAELLKLQDTYSQGLLTYEEYEKAKAEIQSKYAEKSLKKATKSIKGVLSSFSQAVNSLQDAEIANIDSKYDAEIAAAGDNTEKVAELEKQKEEKKLKVKKKYADVNFAIKASQIVVSTAEAIMQALAQLGPIAGPIAAALMGVTGAAQLAIANSERQKIKNMTVSGTSSSKSSATRVASGRAEGGYIDVEREQDGKVFNAKYDPDARGFVDSPTVIVGDGGYGQSREWVASNAAVNNPTVYPVLQMLDRHQRAGTIRSLNLNEVMPTLVGHAAGGAISAGSVAGTSSTVVQTDAPNVDALATTIAAAMSKIKLTAPIVLSDFEAAQERQKNARKIGTR